MGDISKAAIKHTNSTSAPTVNFDSAAGYSINSTHTQTSANGEIAYHCNDASVGAAVWEIFVGEGSAATNLDSHGKVNVAAGVNIGQAAYINDQSGALKAKYGLGDRAGHDSSHLSGLFKESKTDSQDVTVIRKGKLVGTTADPLNTTAFSDAPPERLHLSTSGAIIGDTVGGGGSHLEVGRCLRSHASEGVIEVDIANYIHSIRAWSGGQVELATGSNDNTTWISIQLFDGTEFVKITIDGIYTDHIKEYTEGAGVTIDSVLLKDGDIAAATNLENLELSGVVSWGGSSDYYDAAYLVSDGKFKITRPGVGLILSTTRVPWAADQETGVIAANATTWVYFDSSGDIQSTTTRTDALFKEIVVYEVFYDGNNYLVAKEDHPVCYPTCVSNDRHRAHNIVFDSLNGGGEIFKVAAGDGSAADDRRIKIVGAIDILDHGLITTVPDSSGVGITVNHAYINGSVQWILDSIDSEYPMKWNSSGTPTALGVGKYGVFTQYAGKDDKNTTTPTYLSVMHNEEFNNPTAARSAINTGSLIGISAELADLEFAKQGYIIVQNNASGGIIFEATTAKKTATSETSGQANLASLVQTDTANFDNILSTEANVQDALDTLDDHPIAAHSDTAATGAELETLTDGSNADSLHEHATASLTVAGKIEIGTTAEIDADIANRAVAPDQLAASKYKAQGIIAFEIGDGSTAIPAGAFNAQGALLWPGAITSYRIRGMSGGVLTAGVVAFDVYVDGAKISATAPIELTGVETDVTDSTLTGWTKPFVTGKIIELKAINTPVAVYALVDIYYNKTGA